MDWNPLPITPSNCWCPLDVRNHRPRWTMSLGSPAQASLIRPACRQNHQGRGLPSSAGVRSGHNPQDGLGRLCCTRLGRDLRLNAPDLRGKRHAVRRHVCPPGLQHLKIVQCAPWQGMPTGIELFDCPSGNLGSRAGNKQQIQGQTCCRQPILGPRNHVSGTPNEGSAYLGRYRSCRQQSSRVLRRPTIGNLSGRDERRR
jgi:hypothetical protein